MNGLPSSYDAWKTACCDRWPNCSHCPYDDDYEEEDYEDEDYEDEEGMRIRKRWKITGNDLPPFYLYADSFDEALRLARIINPDYNTGQIVEEDDLI